MTLSIRISTVGQCFGHVPELIDGTGLVWWTGTQVPYGFECTAKKEAEREMAKRQIIEKLDRMISGQTRVIAGVVVRCVDGGFGRLRYELPFGGPTDYGLAGAANRIAGGSAAEVVLSA